MGYFHSVTLIKEKCRGCTNCIKYCPTEAIRVRDGKAIIIDERCIDCGECIRRCPHQAKAAITDSLSLLENYRYKVAMPAPSLYGQFKKDVSVDQILTAFLTLGFDAVYEVAKAAEINTLIIKNKLTSGVLQTPAISSACPAIIRLIQVRYPELLPNIISVESPMSIAAHLAKEKYSSQLGLKKEDIGVFFISPCPAKATSVKHPLGIEKSWVDGVISISSIYGKLLNLLSKEKASLELGEANGVGIGWAIAGGEALAMDLENYLAVDGSEQVSKVLEELEMGKLADIQFFEGHACVGGCVGGPLTVENPFVARRRIRYLADKYKGSGTNYSQGFLAEVEYSLQWTAQIKPREIMVLDKDRAKALEKMNLIEKIYHGLPGLDCGSCGAPSCRALAEDIVRGYGNEIDCIFKLREKLRMLAENMVELSKMVPPALGRKPTEL